MQSALSKLLELLGDKALSSASVIPWGCPVPSFGDLSRSKVATLGLNPSNREFVDERGRELDGELRRFHTLKSLGIADWSDAEEEHLRLIADSCRKYFYRNPYDRWFKSLDDLISGTTASYYDGPNKACHLDLVPFATIRKWAELTKQQRDLLMDLAGDTLGLLLRESSIRILILNGQTVVDSLQSIAGITLNKSEVSAWTLPRKSGEGVKGYAYSGIISEFAGIRLDRNIKVLGFNHNIQSSFGVTSKVKTSMRNWITRTVKKVA